MLNNLIRSVAEPAARGEINPPHAAVPPAPRSRPAPVLARFAFFYGALNTSFNQLYNFNLAQLLTRMDDKVLKTPQIAGWFNSAILHGLLAGAAELQPSPAPAQAAGGSVCLAQAVNQPCRYLQSLHSLITSRDTSSLHDDMIATNGSFSKTH